MKEVQVSSTETAPKTARSALTSGRMLAEESSLADLPSEQFRRVDWRGSDRQGRSQEHAKTPKLRAFGRRATRVSPLACMSRNIGVPHVFILKECWESLCWARVLTCQWLGDGDGRYA